jgi:hypothetical protein
MLLKSSGALVVVLLLCAASPAAAQTSGWTASAGYQMLRLSENFVPLGANFDVASPALLGPLNIVGEFGFVHESDDDDLRNFTLYNLGAGPRWSRPLTSFTPFVQLLAGAEITDSPTDSDTAFMLQPGAGVSVPISDRWSFVGQADYRAVFFDEETNSQFRFVLGGRWGR